MSTLQRILGTAGTGLLAVSLVGIIVRGRYRHYYSFAVYLLAALALPVLIVWWPERFFRSNFYQAQQITLTLVRFAMAIEIAIRTFSSFPGALATMRRLAFVIVTATALALLAIPPGPGDHASFVGQLEPRVLNGTVWLFSAIAILILWYRLPTHPFRKAVLLSYLPYLLVFTVAANALGSLGWERGEPFQYARQIAYLLLVAYWAWLAWRPALAGKPDPVGDEAA